MGLLTVIQKNKYKDKEVRVLFLGLDNAGKTTTLKHLMNEPIDTVSPTFGFSIKTFMHMGVGDVGGQRSLRPYWRNYFEKTDAIVWVVDSGDPARLEDCRKELWNLLGEERLAGATVLILANKQDIPGAYTPEMIKKALQLEDIHAHSWRIQAASAVTGTNINEGMDWLLKDIASRLYYYGPESSA
ncbi:hypothetical protein MVES_001653 [Malassezia vespertilionis]|uniref:Uncharacterized protein n=1 Tax=Malassezia vespertilionis TaxID=2020962 RepID=A0A2N1JD68_9BASI|nr:hypothetical protein MVES_001653 [Malassezia vespertilionis]